MNECERTRIILSNEQAEAILVEVQERVAKNRYSILWHREKNREFYEKFYFSEQMAKEIIGQLDIEKNYCWAEESVHPSHKDEIIIVYKVSLDLTKKEDGKSYKVRVYLKFAYKENNDYIVVISFHEDER